MILTRVDFRREGKGGYRFSLSGSMRHSISVWANEDLEDFPDCVVLQTEDFQDEDAFLKHMEIPLNKYVHVAQVLTKGIFPDYLRFFVWDVDNKKVIYKSWKGDKS